MIWHDLGRIMCIYVCHSGCVWSSEDSFWIVLAFLLAEVVSVWFLLLGCVFHAVWAECFWLTLLCPI